MLSGCYYFELYQSEVMQIRDLPDGGQGCCLGAVGAEDSLSDSCQDTALSSAHARRASWWPRSFSQGTLPKAMCRISEPATKVLQPLPLNFCQLNEVTGNRGRSRSVGNAHGKKQALDALSCGMLGTRPMVRDIGETEMLPLDKS